MIPIKTPYENPFVKCLRLGRERRQVMTMDIAGLYADRNLTAGSKRVAGTQLSVGNRIERIPNSNHDIHRGKSSIIKPLSIVTVDSEDESEIEATDDDVVELSLIEPAVEAGSEANDSTDELEVDAQDEVEEEVEKVEAE